MNDAQHQTLRRTNRSRTCAARVRLVCSILVLLVAWNTTRAYTGAQSSETPSGPGRHSLGHRSDLDATSANGTQQGALPDILTSPRDAQQATRDAPASKRVVPQVKLERITRSGAQNVRVPLEAAASEPALAPDALVVVAGKALVAKERDGSVVLEQANRSTSVLSAAGTKSTSPLSLASTKDKVRLPWLVVDSHSHNTTSIVRSAQPFLKLARAIQWDPESQLHVAEFLIGLEAESGESGDLAEPLDASLVVSCDSVEPQAVRFEAIGPAGDQHVRVGCSAHVKNERAEQELSLRLRGAEYTYTFEIPHRPGRFELQASTTSVLGMGLGEVTLTVVQREEDGTALVAKEPVVVPLHVSDGEIEPNALSIAAGHSQGQVNVHIRGPGELQVRAGLAQQESEPISIQVRWPVLLSCMAPAGGAVGGFLAQRWRRKHPSKKRGRKSHHIMAIVEGAIVGTVLVLTLMLLPSMGLVPDWARTAEIAWFVAAVFAGFLGLELLDRIARVFFRQQREPDRDTETSNGVSSSTARTTQP